MQFKSDVGKNDDSICGQWYSMGHEFNLKYKRKGDKPYISITQRVIVEYADKIRTLHFLYVQFFWWNYHATNCLAKYFLLQNEWLCWM